MVLSEGAHGLPWLSSLAFQKVINLQKENHLHFLSVQKYIQPHMFLFVWRKWLWKDTKETGHDGCLQGRELGWRRPGMGSRLFTISTLLDILDLESHECDMTKHTDYSKYEYTDIHTNINKSHSTIFMMNVDQYHCSYNLK